MNPNDPAPFARRGRIRQGRVRRALLGLLVAGLLAACDTNAVPPATVPSAPASPTAGSVAASTTMPAEATSATAASTTAPTTVPAEAASPTAAVPDTATATPARAALATASLAPTAALGGATATIAPAALTTLPVESPTGGAGATAPPGTPVSPSSSVANSIQAVITRGNHEEEQALAANDPTLLRDTSTASYYNQMAQDVTDMANSGITAIQLLKLTWGAITLQSATSARATTSETWLTTFADGSTLQETDTNVYTLVLQGGTWLVQDDQHPNDRALQPPPGTPGPAASAAPTAPVATAEPSANQSDNWAGYTAEGGTFTAISATWTIPTISATNGLGADATWVGIGGLTSTDLIQAGTDAGVQNGQVSYTAWWETLPQASQPIPMTVAAGDTMEVSLAQQGSGQWQVIITDSTRQETFQTRLRYASSRSSAEWIEESPTAGRRLLLPLDNFGSVSFSGARTVENGRTRTIAQAGGKPITLSVPGGAALAIPSALGADGASFTVTRTDVPAPRIAPGGGRRRGP